MNKKRYHEDREDFPSKRRRVTSEPKEIEDRLESLIVRVGEKSTSSLESNLEGLADVLEADLPTYKKKILDILCDCVVKMPEKTTIYSTLAGLLNAKNYNFGGEFVEMLIKNLKDLLKRNMFEDAANIVRYVADLVNCHVISAGSLVNFFQHLVEVTLEVNSPQVRSDFYVYSTLRALPWVGRELFEKKDQELEHLLNTIEKYLGKRQKPYLPALKVWMSDDPHPQEEYLDCLWAQITKLKGDKWVERHIYRPYLAFDGVLCEALQHHVATVTPPPHHPDIQYPFPTVIFRLFDYTDVPEGPILPGSHSIERFLIEEQLLRVIQQNFLERKDCSAILLSFPGKQKIPLEYMIVEVIFSEMFRLPKSKYLEICLSAIILELCKLQPSSMPQVLAQAVELLYDRLETMNVDCVDRFASWFSHHLSNFQFRWSWDDWNDWPRNDTMHPKSRFIIEAFKKCLRLSYHQRIVDVVPDSFSPLLPKMPVPMYKYEGDEAGALPGGIAAMQLLNAIREKCTTQEALDLLKDVPNPLQEDDVEPPYNPLKIDILVQTLFYAASKSFSHAFAAIAKFRDTFLMLASVEEAQICILKAVYELWKDHEQILGVLINKFLKTKIIECSAVANWLFSKEMAPDFPKMFIWEILDLTILMMSRHVEKLQAKVDYTREKLRKMEDDSMGDQESSRFLLERQLESEEEKLESAQSDQKNLFLIIFQRFILCLTEHISCSESEGKDFNSTWFQVALGRLQQVLLQHHVHVFKYVNTLETLLFTSDIDSHILRTFHQFRGLKL